MSHGRAASTTSGCASTATVVASWRLRRLHLRRSWPGTHARSEPVMIDDVYTSPAPHTTKVSLASLVPQLPRHLRRGGCASAHPVPTRATRTSRGHALVAMFVAPRRLFRSRFVVVVAWESCLGIYFTCTHSEPAPPHAHPQHRARRPGPSSRLGQPLTLPRSQTSSWWEHSNQPIHGEIY